MSLPTTRFQVGHVLDVLRTLPENSVHCVVTSPPYWGLRDYGIEAQVWGGDPACEHGWDEMLPPHHSGQVEQTKWKDAEASGKGQTAASGQLCTQCSAWRGSLGLEPTPELYVEHLVAVFREVRRVLRDDGTLWLNLGDCYASSPPGNKATGLAKWSTSGLHGARISERYAATLDASAGARRSTLAPGLKPKDLIGIPWRVAFALQADGWYLRSDIIWSKNNPMPESVTDRPTKAHEYVFLLSKSARYYYDAEAVKEPAIRAGKRPGGGVKWSIDGLTPNGSPQNLDVLGRRLIAAGRNLRSVWTIPTQPYPEAHFATFPENLVRPCVLAGTSGRGVCVACGAPWERVVRKSRSFESGSGRAGHLPIGKNGPRLQGGGETVDVRRGPVVESRTIGWAPTCQCQGQRGRVEPATALDPFAGSGTVLAVARKLWRSAVGIELNAAYVEMAERRLGRAMPRRKWTRRGAAAPAT